MSSTEDNAVLSSGEKSLNSKESHQIVKLFNNWLSVRSDYIKMLVMAKLGNDYKTKVLIVDPELQGNALDYDFSEKETIERAFRVNEYSLEAVEFGDLQSHRYSSQYKNLMKQKKAATLQNSRKNYAYMIIGLVVKIFSYLFFSVIGNGTGNGAVVQIMEVPNQKGFVMPPVSELLQLINGEIDLKGLEKKLEREQQEKVAIL
ncbi:hypothetical protein HK099_005182, partial [Clydaea vesicula]